MQIERRSVNERLRTVNEPFAQLLGTYEVVCECGDPACDLLLEVPAAVYARVRADDRAVVHPDHVGAARVVAARDGWALVQ